MKTDMMYLLFHIKIENLLHWTLKVMLNVKKSKQKFRIIKGCIIGIRINRLNLINNKFF